MVFLVSEIGVNWNGDLSILNKMVSLSKESGCSAVKFQSFNEEVVINHPEKNLLLKCSVSKENIDDIDKICKKNRIEWFCTPMYADAVDLLDPYIDKFKVRESDGGKLLIKEETPLIKKILNSNKELIISSEKSPMNSEFYKDSRINWLYCIPKYPTKLNEINFVQLKDFKGFSNHCPDIRAPIIASMLGAEIIEIHVTLDKFDKYFDNNVSFSFSEVKKIRKLIDTIQNNLNGNGL